MKFFQSIYIIYSIHRKILELFELFVSYLFDILNYFWFYFYKYGNNIRYTISISHCY